MNTAKEHLTAARIRVLASAAEGHIRRGRYAGDVHVTPQECISLCCQLRDYQNVGVQVRWLVSNGLLAADDSVELQVLGGAGAYKWTWRPTPDGWAALGRSPECWCPDANLETYTYVDYCPRHSSEI